MCALPRKSDRAITGMQEVTRTGRRGVRPARARAHAGPRWNDRKCLAPTVAFGFTDACPSPATLSSTDWPFEYTNSNEWKINSKTKKNIFSKKNPKKLWIHKAYGNVNIINCFSSSFSKNKNVVEDSFFIEIKIQVFLLTIKIMNFWILIIFSFDFGIPVFNSTLSLARSSVGLSIEKLIPTLRRSYLLIEGP